MHQRAFLLLSLFAIPLLVEGSPLTPNTNTLDIARVMDSVELRNCATVIPTVRNSRPKRH
jgi:hypothetical protein